MMAKLLVGLLLFVAVQAVQFPPRLSTPTRDVRVTEGQSGVVLECVLDVGNDPVEYMWIKNHLWVTGSLGYAYRGYGKVFLALHTIRKEHAGRYTCQAKNEAGLHSTDIAVYVEPKSDLSTSNPAETPRTDDMLAELSASLSDVLAEADCQCDMMFLLHASRDAPQDLVSVQANLINVIAENIISESVRVSLMTYSDYVQVKLPFGVGTNECALRRAFTDLSHDMWATSIPSILRDVFKKMKKSRSACKVMFLPVIGSIGTAGLDPIGAQNLKKMGITIFVLEVTDSPIEGLSELASKRGDGKPYHWRVPMKVWPSLPTYMQYMSEEILSCTNSKADVPGVCVGEGKACAHNDQCRGAGMGCLQGTCQSLECNVDTTTPGCCAVPGRFWCGDVTKNCTSSVSFCDGKVHCMNGKDENTCWARPCPSSRPAQCESTTLCLSLSELCDGHTNCPAGEDEDENFCMGYPCPDERPFRCKSGRCISRDNVCDGKFMDCEMGEDETLDYCYKTHSCTGNRPFKCDYGVCIENTVVCDGVYNCLDGGDEKHCHVTTCPVGRPFKCQHGECIALDTVCNGVIDGCSDGSDEMNCANFTCPPERSFKCNNGRCIDSWLKCNKGDDCGDKSDELGCVHEPSYRTTPPSTSRPGTTQSTVKPVCSDSQFSCQSGACIPLDMVCDGRSSCLNGDDEINCESRECPANRSYRCETSKACVNAIVCDGIDDCNDGSDEKNCVIVDDSDDENLTYDEYRYDDYEYKEMVEEHGVPGGDETNLEDVDPTVETADDDAAPDPSPNPSPSDTKDMSDDKEEDPTALEVDNKPEASVDKSDISAAPQVLISFFHMSFMLLMAFKVIN